MRKKVELKKARHKRFQGPIDAMGCQNMFTFPMQLPWTRSAGHRRMEEFFPPYLSSCLQKEEVILTSGTQQRFMDGRCSIRRTLST